MKTLTSTYNQFWNTVSRPDFDEAFIAGTIAAYDLPIVSAFIWVIGREILANYQTTFTNRQVSILLGSFLGIATGIAKRTLDIHQMRQGRLT